jgi:predicted nuclease of predicted toxin-antitoxin system
MLAGYKILADQNIHAAVIAYLRSQGSDVVDANSAGLGQAADATILQAAFAENRIVVTHDRDFGRLAILTRQPLVGIVYLRPGHINPQFTIETLDALSASFPAVSPPFVIVAQRRAGTVRIRGRQV